MSSLTVTGNASGTAVFTIAAPGTSTNRTLTLPDETSTLATQAYSNNASNLSTGTVPTARLGSGTANNTTFLRGDQTWQPINATLGGFYKTDPNSVAFTKTGFNTP